MWCDYVGGLRSSVHAIGRCARFVRQDSPNGNVWRGLGSRTDWVAGSRWPIRYLELSNLIDGNILHNDSAGSALFSEKNTQDESNAGLGGQVPVKAMKTVESLAIQAQRLTLRGAYDEALPLYRLALVELRVPGRGFAGLQSS